MRPSLVGSTSGRFAFFHQLLFATAITGFGYKSKTTFWFRPITPLRSWTQPHAARRLFFSPSLSSFDALSKGPTVYTVKSSMSVYTVNSSMSTPPDRRTKRSATAADSSSPSNKGTGIVTLKKTKKLRSKKQSVNDDEDKSIIDSTTSSSNSNEPWYIVFTKGDEQYTQYMKNEWGFEKRGDEAMFEKLSLEGAQAGLSWLTILRKREAYRKTFHNFDIDKVAAMTLDDVQAILDTPKSVDTRQVVVKHRGKIEAVIHNAKCIQQMRKDAETDMKRSSNNYFHGVFDEFLWTFVDDKPIVNNHWNGKKLTDCPSTSPESEAMSEALKQIGFKFVGATTCYSMMQAYGMVIDHPTGSPEYEAAVKRLEQRPGGYQVPPVTLALVTH